ncbi:hypothetical protein [Flavobacterium sp. CAU 1735]|uniref:hypothetical protein n=1 Tax=Flavobacterium sp. CAU 1735 TaxID=3140361 RepID=UPI00325FF08E
MENLFKKLVTFFNELSSNDLIELHEESLFPQEFNLSDRLLQRYQKKFLMKQVLNLATTL